LVVLELDQQFALEFMVQFH